MSTGKDSLPRMPCQCGNPDWFHDGPCRPPPTLDSVVRSPRFYAIKRDGDGWFVVVRTGAEIAGVAGLEIFDGDTIDGAVAAAALRIDAVNAAERTTSRKTWGSAVSSPVNDVCAIARQFTERNAVLPSPGERPLNPEERKP